MSNLFDSFPELNNGTISIHMMEESDVDDLIEITHNSNAYRYTPPFLYMKSRRSLITIIKNLRGRDFEKHKMVIAGIYHNADKKLVGIIELFHIKKRKGKAELGYKLNEDYWHQGITSMACSMIIEYLKSIDDIKFLVAHIMPENIHSSRIILKNGFILMPYKKEDHNWGNYENVTLDVYELQIR